MYTAPLRRLASPVDNSGTAATRGTMAAAVVMIAAIARAATAPSSTCDTGWCENNGGAVKHAAIGLVANTSALDSTGVRLVIGTTHKHAQNPLFQQDRPWEPRLDNGYPNVVFDPTSGARGDGPWRLWYGGIAPGGQYLYYANSTDGLAWTKPTLNRYDLSKWPEPWAKSVGKANNIIMVGGGLGLYHDLHETNPALSYKISGGAPAGCYSSDGAHACAIGTAGSPDGINNWTDVQPFAFSPPWRSDCHTNLFFDNRRGKYMMTTRDYTSTTGRDIGISVSGGGGGGSAKHWTGNWTLLYKNEYPPTAEAAGHGCERVSVAPGQDVIEACGLRCRATDNCAYFWVYTAGKYDGTCCPKSAVLPGKLVPPACPSCGGEFFQMDGKPSVGPPPAPSAFGDWSQPAIVETGTEAYQLYSQITFPFFDVYLGIVMVFDAQTGKVGPNAGHVHCRLAWSRDGLAGWEWVDQDHATSHDSSMIPDFIPAGPLGSFDSHVCFAAHLPMRMPDSSVRVYYMGGNGPHSGARNSSFALTTLRPDGFAGLGGTGTVKTRPLLVASARLIVTADVVTPAGRVVVSVAGGGGSPIRSDPIVANVTDGAVTFPGQGIAPLVGTNASFTLELEGAVVYAVGFDATVTER